MQARWFVSYLSPHQLLLALCLLAVAPVLLPACAAGGDTSDSDGDGDTEFPDGDTDVPIDGDREDGDSDETDETPNCFTSGCDEGFYCDEYDGLCKGCTTDLHCGYPDPISGVVPVCRNGRCLDVVCGTILTLQSPPDGVSLGVNPLSSSIGTDGLLAVGGNPVFPLGVSGLHPDHFDKVRQAGGNLVVSTRNCCTNAMDLDYQLNTFLPEVRRADLYAALHAVAPVADYEANDPFTLLESIRNRANHPALMAWLSGENAVQDGAVSDALAVHDEILGVVRSKIIGFGERSDANLNAYEGAGSFFLVSLDPDSASPGSDLARLSRKPAWARIGSAEFPPADYLLAALHAIAHGAKGIVFDLDREDLRPLPGNWESITASLRYIKDRTLLWLLPRETQAVRVTESAPEVATFTVRYENKVNFVFLVNAASEPRTVALTITPTHLPYCMGVETEDTVLHMTREQDITLTLAPRSIKVLQITEALPPGEDGGR